MTNKEILKGFKKLKMETVQTSNIASNYNYNTISPEFGRFEECGILKDCTNTTYTNKTTC